MKSLPDAAAFLKPEFTFELLDQHATARTDNEAALQLNEARTKLFQSINPLTIDLNMPLNFYPLTRSLRLIPGVELTEWEGGVFTGSELVVEGRVSLRQS